MDVLLYLAKWLFAVVTVAALVALIFTLFPGKEVTNPKRPGWHMGETNPAWTMISGTIVMVCVIGAVIMGLTQCAGLVDVPSNLGYSYP